MELEGGMDRVGGGLSEEHGEDGTIHKMMVWQTYTDGKTEQSMHFTYVHFIVLQLHLNK